MSENVWEGGKSLRAPVYFPQRESVSLTDRRFRPKKGSGKVVSTANKQKPRKSKNEGERDKVNKSKQEFWWKDLEDLDKSDIKMNTSNKDKKGFI